MKLTGCSTLWLWVVALVVILMQGLVAESRAVQLRQPNEAHVISKRNAWWSKKSTDEVNRISQGHNYAFNNSPSETADVQQAIDCYTGTCVSEFVWCGSQAVSRGDFSQCKLQHRRCASGCFGTSAGRIGDSGLTSGFQLPLE